VGRIISDQRRAAAGEAGAADVPECGKPGETWMRLAVIAMLVGLTRVRSADYVLAPSA